jgi:hypothetical protein
MRACQQRQRELQDATCADAIDVTGKKQRARGGAQTERRSGRHHRRDR